MDAILRGYSVNPATWFYLSLLLIIAIFFRFSRLWSLRNFDLGLLLSASPGLLLVESGGKVGETDFRVLGYSWLFVVSGILLVRLLVDTILTRRPQFAQNLNAAGMAFLCVCSFIFLSVQAVTRIPGMQFAEPVAVVADDDSVQTPVAAPLNDPASEKPAVASPLISTPVELVAEHLHPAKESRRKPWPCGSLPPSRTSRSCWG